MDLKKITTFVFQGEKERFPTWSRQMRSMATLWNLAKPLADDLTDRDRELLADDNTKLYHQLLVSLSDKVVTKVSSVKVGDGRALWDRLHELYAPKSAAHVQAITTQLLGATLAASGSVLALIETLHSVDPDLTIAEEAMTQAPYTVTPDTPLDEVVATMAGQRYGSALVMEHERIVGVFTTTDALEALVELLRPHPGRA